jgi:hypothetical protein
MWRVSVASGNWVNQRFPKDAAIVVGCDCRSQVSCSSYHGEGVHLAGYQGLSAKGS